MTTDNKDPFGNFDALFKPFADAWNAGIEQATLAASCKMRRFYLQRHEDTDPDRVSGTGIVAEGVVYEDGTVSMRWKTKHTSTAVYAGIEDVQAIHGHNGKTVIKYVDPEKP